LAAGVAAAHNIRLSNKSVDKGVATVGDVLTYTVVIDKRGGPNQQQSLMVDMLAPEVMVIPAKAAPLSFSAEERQKPASTDFEE
jgi:uncharacterized repeat protein (TIGR01451 family)